MIIGWAAAGAPGPGGNRPAPFPEARLLCGLAQPPAAAACHSTAGNDCASDSSWNTVTEPGPGHGARVIERIMMADPGTVLNKLQ